MSSGSEKKSNFRSKRFHYTLNNYTDADIPKLKKVPGIEYCFVGEEVGESGTPHLQGYLELSRRMTLGSLQKRVQKCGLRMYLNHCNGSRAQNEEYCCKDGKWEQWGTPSEQGKRTDVHELNEECKTKSVDVVLAENPEMSFKYAASIAKVVAAHKAIKHKAIQKRLYARVTLRPWQLDACDTLREQGDRTVLWFVDYRGGKGKTYLGKWLHSRGAFLVRSGKTADISYAFDFEKTVVFDFTRDREEFVNYSVIEGMKDGILFSPKYQSCTKVWEGSKVIVFSNWMPDVSKMSEDRWQIVELSERIRIAAPVPYAPLRDA